MAVSDTGLDRRLRQHGRRSDIGVGLTMAATIALVVGATAWIFVRLQPLVSDFVSEVTPRVVVAGGVVAAATEAPAPRATQAAPGRAPTPPIPTTTPATFAPDLQVNPALATSVRLRAEPSVAGGDATVLTTLPPGTPLQATGGEAPTANPAQDGDRWIEVRTATGQQGWIRAIDTRPA